MHIVMSAKKVAAACAPYPVKPQLVAADIVACFAQVILHCGPGAVVGIHDLADRPQYHAVREIAREIATVENLSFFLPRPGAGPQARAILEAHRFTPE